MDSKNWKAQPNWFFWTLRTKKKKKAQPNQPTADQTCQCQGQLSLNWIFSIWVPTPFGSNIIW